MKKRVLTCLLVLVMLAGLLPMGALAVETSPASTATVSFTAQAEDTFLCAPQLGVEVDADLAERYGYTDSVEGVSALDVLVKAHEVMFETDFTAESAGDYLSVDGGTIKKIFGVETMNCFFTVNGQQPHDDVLVDMAGVPGGKSYTGYTINQTAVHDGDLLEFWICQNDYGMDKYPLFQQDGDFVTALQGVPGETLSLTLNYYWIGWYGCIPMETLKATPRQIKVLEDAQLAWVNTADGTLQVIEDSAVAEDGAVSLTLPAAQGSYYLTVSLPEEEVIMPLITVTAACPDAAITVPGDATLFVGSKIKHFVAFTEVEPAAGVDNGDGTSTYYYDLKNNGTYNYRVSGGDYISYGGTFKKTANYALTVTAEQLRPEGKTKTTVERDVNANNKYNVADIYLNINPQGWLRLDAAGDNYQLVNLRSWQAVDSTVNNYFIEPDYHYTVLDESGNVSDSVVSVSAGGLVTARGEGTAIVLVTYDAFQYANGAGGPFFGAIWPENTGVFVATVGAGDSAINTGMTIHPGKNSTDAKLSGDALDAEHDVIYFTGDSGSYTFTPVTKGCAVSVDTPIVGDSGMGFSGFQTVSANADGSFTVPLAQGRNIVRLTKDGESAYQVITAKALNITAPERLAPGEEVSVSVDTLYHPANKLAGVYNMSAVAVYTDVDGYAGRLVGGSAAQYNFAATDAAQTVGKLLTRNATAWSVSYRAGAQITVPVDWAEESFTLSGGSLIAVGFGDPYGGHRSITAEQGKDPNFNAGVREAYLGQLPDITIPVTLSKTVRSVTVPTAPARTEYYVGDSFDPAGMVVHAVYSDGSESDVSSYTVSPEVLTADTTAVTVSYGGTSAEVPVTVTLPAVTALAVTTPPARTAYTAGDVFDPTGMVVTATYENGQSAVAEDYDLEPKRALMETDSEITVKLGAVQTTTPITVAAAPAPGPDAPADITVKFTLLGDEAHGAPEGAGDTHTLKGGNLTAWIPETEITVPADAKVIDVVARALGLAGIPYENPDGNYITAIRGMREFTNGDLSGWMYTLNGSHPKLGVAEQSLKNGDRIVFHYTDDYSVERGSEQWSGETTLPEKNVPLAGEPKTFVDVTTAHWAKEAVDFVSTRGLFQGTSETKFSPELPMSRAMLATVLYRLEDGKAGGDINPFADVAAGTWYTDAVIWAGANDIVNGTNKGFEPARDISRQELVTMLYRYAGHVGLDTARTADLSKYTDRGDLADWAAEAMGWAVEAGLVKGRSATSLAPTGTATRAEVAAIIQRLAALMDK